MVSKIQAAHVRYCTIPKMSNRTPVVSSATPGLKAKKLETWDVPGITLGDDLIKIGEKQTYPRWESLIKKGDEK
jgi:hypothetical protein